MTARIRYQTIEVGELDIHLKTLRDRQQYADVHGVAAKLGISDALWPIFGVVWESSEMLAQLMLDEDIQGRRILEVGCGMALASHVLNHRNADITATDYHPEVESFLFENVRLNAGRSIPYIRTGWTDALSELGTFDLIVGSDLLYEQGHARQLAEFICQHSKPVCEVVLIDPGRGHHAHFSKNMVALGYSLQQTKAIPKADTLPGYSGQILRYTR
ncbi:MAG TPA: histidine kinase [Spongiibacteraceae bacterium]|nr:histidine kinase [Spongiibacteraceae bacterium]HCS26109.1 histidine kinase [Spongiibacteraceae bacterium]|tara:strand:+ start:489 stop:1136 length:648 start_codon:yes stop_codon:yes gene_type:complete